MKMFMMALFVTASFSVLSSSAPIGQVILKKNCKVIINEDIVVQKFEDKFKFNTKGNPNVPWYLERSVKLVMKQADHFQRRRLKKGKELKVDYVSKEGIVFADPSVLSLVITNHRDVSVSDVSLHSNGKLTMVCDKHAAPEIEI